MFRWVPSSNFKKVELLFFLKEWKEKTLGNWLYRGSSYLNSSEAERRKADKILV